MSIETAQLAKDLEGAFNQIGTSMMSDEFAAKLLAYVYIMGGGNEMVVHHEGLNAGINIAQQKFNIFGGEVPDMNGVVLIRKYVKELEASLDKSGSYTAEWISEIAKRYNLKIK